MEIPGASDQEQGNPTTGDSGAADSITQARSQSLRSGTCTTVTNGVGPAGVRPDRPSRRSAQKVRVALACASCRADSRPR